MSFQAIGIREIEKYLNRPNTSLIDLRTREEFALCHFEGAQNIPYDELAEYKQYLSRNMEYILYCERGGSSLMAAKELSQEGFHVYTVVGGIRAWQEAYKGTDDAKDRPRL